MSRDQLTGHCDKCCRSFRYFLIHNGFNDTGYAYCDSCCYVALLDHYGAPSHVPKVDFGVITPEIERFLLPCPSRGRFTAAAHPRCPHCNEPLDAIKAAEYIEANGGGTQSDRRWRQRSWSGVYCLIIENRVVNNPWKPPQCS